MMDRKVSALLATVMVGAAFASARAADVTVYPSDVPDEQPPRIATGDAPVGFGPDSWMNSATGKVNVYITALQLFGHSVAIGDIASISYSTKAPSGGGPASENWFLNVYTEHTGSGDDASWFGKRFFNSDYTSYTSDGAWHDNTIASMQYSSGGGGPSQLFATWTSDPTYKDLSVLFFSPQTNSGVNGNDAQIDGLIVTLKSGEIRSVDFAAPVPLPAAAWSGMATLGGLALAGRWKRRRSQNV